MTTPRTTYDTIADAIAAGWRRVNRKTDRDVSGGNSFGYQFKAPDGQQSTTIKLRKERNKIGQPGCVAQMFRA